MSSFAEPTVEGARRSRPSRPRRAPVSRLGLILMAPALLLVFETFRPEPLTLFTIFTVGCAALSLYLLPRLKGAIVGYQWARQLHGFGKPA